MVCWRARERCWTGRRLWSSRVAHLAVAKRRCRVESPRKPERHGGGSPNASHGCHPLLLAPGEQSPDFRELEQGVIKWSISAFQALPRAQRPTWTILESRQRRGSRRPASGDFQKHLCSLAESGNAKRSTESTENTGCVFLSFSMLFLGRHVGPNLSRGAGGWCKLRPRSENRRSSLVSKCRMYSGNYI